MNVGKAFSYVFEDREWLSKLLFGALFQLLSLVLIGIPFVVGYSLEIVRNVHRGDPNPLPAWTNLGEKFVDGLKLVVAVLIYALPLFLLICCSTLFQQIAAQGGQSGEVRAVAGIAVAFSLLLSCVQFLYALLLQLLMPAIYLQYARTSSIPGALRVGEVIAVIRRVPGPVVLTFLSLGVIVCLIGVFVTSIYAAYVNAHLYGQVWREFDARAAVV
ncbi:MAG: DUF4013 domain-containing protein [Chloroflexi bacterium]|nr:DUF4013 domain-containing protein [Chloroflexota bacterium]